MWIYNPITTRCFRTYNPKLDLPSDLIPINVRQITLPSKTTFTTINPVKVQERFYMEFGSGLSAKNKFSTAGCDNIQEDGKYQFILGTFPNGDQAMYNAHNYLDENSLDNPISDGGSTMMKMNTTGYDNDDHMVPVCPVPLKSFLNSKYMSPKILFICY